MNPWEYKIYFDNHRTSWLLNNLSTSVMRKNKSVSFLSCICKASKLDHTENWTVLKILSLFHGTIALLNISPFLRISQTRFYTSCFHRTFKKYYSATENHWCLIAQSWGSKINQQNPECSLTWCASGLCEWSCLNEQHFSGWTWHL